MARYANKDFGLGKPNKKEKQTAQKMANMAKGKSPAKPKSKLSAAMYTWADTNMSKLKNPTKKQQEIFRKYKSMKAAGDTPSNPKPKPTTKSTTKTTTTRKTPKPAQVAKAKAAATSDSSTGIRGSFRKSNPPSPTVERKASKTGSQARYNRTDPRRRSVQRNLREAAAAKRRRERKEAFSKPPMRMSPPPNPKEGDMYRKPFGPLMIYKNGKFVRA